MNTRPNNKDTAIERQELADKFRDAANIILDAEDYNFYTCLEKAGIVAPIAADQREYSYKIVNERYINSDTWISYAGDKQRTNIAMLCLFIACAIETGD